MKEAESVNEVQLKPELANELRSFAKARKIRKLILFGSRARGDNLPKSDIDLAVSGGDIGGFTDDVNEKAWTLLQFDVVDLNRPLADAFRASIEKEGIVLYEEV